MDRTFRVSRPPRRMRGGWAWLIAGVLAGVAGALGSPASHAEAASVTADAPSHAPVDTPDRRG